MLLHEFINIGKRLYAGGSTHCHYAMRSDGIAELCGFLKALALGNSGKEARTKLISGAGGIDPFNRKICRSKIAFFAALANVSAAFAGLDYNILYAVFEENIGDLIDIGLPCHLLGLLNARHKEIEIFKGRSYALHPAAGGIPRGIHNGELAYLLRPSENTGSRLAVKPMGKERTGKEDYIAVAKQPVRNVTFHHL